MGSVVLRNIFLRSIWVPGQLGWRSKGLTSGQKGGTYQCRTGCASVFWGGANSSDGLGTTRRHSLGQFLLSVLLSPDLDIFGWCHPLFSTVESSYSCGSIKIYSVLPGQTSDWLVASHHLFWGWHQLLNGVKFKREWGRGQPFYVP